MTATFLSGHSFSGRPSVSRITRRIARTATGPSAAIASAISSALAMPAGQIVGRITQVRPVADVMAELLRETDEALDRLRGLR